MSMYSDNEVLEEEIMTLDEICLTTNSDKGSKFHDYCRTYDELFSPLRNQSIRLLEMGVLGGDSLLMWSRYFTHPDTRIIGIDIETHRCQKIEDSRVGVSMDSQADEGFWKRCDDRSFDICISDAGHFLSQEKEAFRLGWQKVKPGGFWCVEDCHVYVSPQHCDIPGQNVMQWLTGIAIDMQGQGADASGRVEATDKYVSIDTISFRKGLCVLRRAR